MVRGNVETRLRKASEGLDAVVLAYAGLRRLGLADHATYVFSPDEMLPAVAQGALARCGKKAHIVLANGSVKKKGQDQNEDARKKLAKKVDLHDRMTAPRALAYDPPPEPSLYLLDGQSSAVYQLSLKLSLVRQFRPYFSLPAPITSVALDASKRLYAAAGDNVYLAARP